MIKCCGKLEEKVEHDQPLICLFMTGIMRLSVQYRLLLTILSQPTLNLLKRKKEENSFLEARSSSIIGCYKTGFPAKDSTIS